MSTAEGSSAAAVKTESKPADLDGAVLSMANLQNKAYHKELWQAAFEQGQGGDLRIAQKLVKQYMAMPADQLGKCIEAIFDLRQADVEGYNNKFRNVISPLVKYHVTSLHVSATQGRQANKEKKDWRFHEATFEGNPEIEEFLRSRERTGQIHGFGSLAEARKFVAANQEKCSKAALKAGTRLMKPQGRGEDAYLELTKRKEKGPKGAQQAPYKATRIARRFDKLMNKSDKKSSVRAARLKTKKAMGKGKRRGREDSVSIGSASSDQDEHDFENEPPPPERTTRSGCLTRSSAANWAIRT